MGQRKLLLEVGDILDTYCEGCFLKKFHRKEYGKTYAQRFCINQCTVGEKLKKYGKNLS